MRPLLNFILLLAGALGLSGQTGTNVPELAAFDEAVPALLRKYKVPGAALALGKDGRLVYARGFGVADVDTGEAVQPDSLFRVASVSKPLTAVGVLKLVEEGKVTLDTRVLAFLGRTARADARYNNITVRHLLQHTGGMDIFTWGLDPSFPDRATLEALGAPLPPGRGDVLDFVLTNLPLASAPGEKYAYSNIGYVFLTEVIEKASGQRYEAYMREKIFAPLGITRMRVAGPLLTGRGPGEVKYFDGPNTGAPIFPGLPAEVPAPYGAFNTRIFKSGGGWVATAGDLIRFANGVDKSILRPETVRLMTEKPAYEDAGARRWYGMGWDVERTLAGETWDHTGGMPGTSAWMIRGSNGVSLAIAANSLPADEVALDFFADVNALYERTRTIRPWPAGDLSERYFPGGAPRIAHAGVVNAASQRPGAVAAGSTVLLFGANLAGGTVRVNGVKAETQWEGPGAVWVQVPAAARGGGGVPGGRERAEFQRGASDGDRGGAGGVYGER